MKPTVKIYCFVYLAFFVLALLPAAASNDPALESKVHGWVQKSKSLRFLENRGQMTDLQSNVVNDLLFKANGAGTDLYVTTNGLSYVFTKIEKQIIPQLSSSTKLQGRGGRGENESMTVQYCRTDMELVGADIRKENIIKEYESEDRTDYYLAHCPQGIRNVHSYEKVTIKNIYPGIDWVLYSLKVGKLESQKRNEEGLEYDFVVHPGADPGLIRLRYKWTDKPILQKDGSLKIATPMGDIIEGIPVSYVRDKEHKINTHYRIEDDGIGFILDKYTKGDTLIIDPTLVWATYSGGSDLEDVFSVNADGINVWVTGTSKGTGFPLLNPNPGIAYFQGSYSVGTGLSDLIILQFNTCGARIWASYYGGSGTDYGYSINSDKINVWVTGQTYSTDFPLQNRGGAYNQVATESNGDAFVLQFSCISNALVWASFLGGSGYEIGQSINSDGTNVWITGQTKSTNFPTQFPPGAYTQATRKSGIGNIFISQFKCATGELMWSSYYGGSDINSDNGDIGNSISSDGTNVWVTGSSASTDFPTLFPPGSYVQANLGGPAAKNAFVLQFSCSNSALVWASYFGGSGGIYGDVGNSISSDGKNVWVTGTTTSSNFPLQDPGGGAYKQPTLGAKFAMNGFIAQFSCANSSLVWSTYYGGSSVNPFDVPYSIQSDGRNVWVSGQVGSSDFPTMQSACGFYQPTLAGGSAETFILQFNTSGVRKWATYYGNDFENDGSYISSDGTNLFVAADAELGSTYKTLNPPGGSAYYRSAVGATENVYMAKFTIFCSALIVNNDTTICPGGSAMLKVSGGSGYTWSPTTGLSSPTGSSVTATPSGTITYTVTGISDANCGVASAPTSTTVTVTVSKTISAKAIEKAEVSCYGGSNGEAIVLASGGTGTLTYSWSNTVTGVTGITGLPAGPYIINVTDSLGCSATSSVNITQPIASLTATTAQTAAGCGPPNGTAEVTAMGGTVTYTYNWAPAGGTGQTATGLNPGTYTVIVTDANGCSTMQTITVMSNTTAPIVTATSSSDLNCTITSSTLRGISAGNSMVWNGGTLVNVADPAIVNEAGIYTVTATDLTNNCTASSTVSVQGAPGPTLTGEAINTCLGKSDGAITLITTGTGLTYSWSNASISQNQSGLASGSYTVTITDVNGCTATTATSILQLPNPIANAGIDETIIQGQRIQLSASGGTSYLWSPSVSLNYNNIYNPVASPSQTTNYVVTVTDGSSCTAKDSVLITVIDCNASELFVPTAFSPNGDGQNDVFYIRAPDCITQIEITLYDRWGELVFETINPGQGWDGTFRGKSLGTGVFSFYLTANLSNGQHISRKGNVTLLR